jgi:quercetin dioxygenase-like cupin family protein
VTADGETLTAGDYHRAAAGSLHGAQTTESGCLLLIISSTHDNFVVDTPQP